MENNFEIKACGMKKKGSGIRVYENPLLESY
jgi:hypothetical protein